MQVIAAGLHIRLHKRAMLARRAVECAKILVEGLSTIVTIQINYINISDIYIKSTYVSYLEIGTWSE